MNIFSSVDVLDRAAQFAKRMHGDQIWNNGVPYFCHLADVCAIVATYTEGNPSREDLMAAAWLHDVVEDTPATFDQIEDEFGPIVRGLVWAVTDEPGSNRAERHAKTYPKVRNYPNAIYLKLADRISNVEASRRDRGGYFDMYRKEHAEFSKALRKVGVATDMWTRLDDALVDPLKKTIKLRNCVMAEIAKHVHPFGPLVDGFGLQSALTTVIDDFLRDDLKISEDPPNEFVVIDPSKEEKKEEKKT